jgi:hypothetical protein
MELSVDKDSAITHLSQHYGHNSINITKTYLGLEDNIMDEYDVYNVVDMVEGTVEKIEEYKDFVPSMTKGIYFLYDKDKTIVYIGKSIQCIRQRINVHYYQNPSKYLTDKQREELINRRKEYKYFSFIPLEENGVIDSKEIEYISEHKPIYNKEYLYG